MNKTPMQELIEELKANDVAHGMYWIKQPNTFFEKYLEKEKNEIIDAWMATDNELQRLAAEEYYNQKFNQNQ